MQKTANTTLVNVDPDIMVTLNEFLSRLIGSDGSSFANDCKALVESNQTDLLIAKYTENIDVIFGLDDQKDVESCIQAIVSVVLSLKEGDDAIPHIKVIIDKVASNQESKPKLRLISLLSLLNLTSTNEAKLYALTVLLKYAIATNQTKYVSHFHKHTDDWITVWSISQQDRRLLYRLMSEVLTKDDQYSLAVKFLSRYLETFKNESLPADIEVFTTTAVVNAIKSSVQSFNDRNELLQSISMTLEGDLALLVKLLSIICQGNLSDYLLYESKNKEFMTSKGLACEEIKHSMYLLAICSLGVQNTVLSFQDIASALNIAQEEVESWIVEAISYGLMDASIDQSTSTVTISRCRHLSFGPHQWKNIQMRLSSLRGSLSSVVETLRKHN